ncbi:MAG: ABC transporter permease [Janthinobacterium lividum]
MRADNVFPGRARPAWSIRRVWRGPGRHALLRAGGALLTLWLLSMLVFGAGQWLPGNVARAVLGPLADPRAVAAMNHQLGVDRPLLVQYGAWLAHLLRGDLGQSTTYRAPVAPYLLDALGHSARLGLLAFVLVVPLGIAGGVRAAVRQGRWVDRLVTLLGLAATVVPEFISSIALILIFGVGLRWLPVSAGTPPGTPLPEQLRHLLMPALPLIMVYFGYIARIARVGTLDALAADYTRTAVLKGLPMRTVILRHVLRNALLPTVTVATTQLGYLIGGLVVVETIFHYQGIGSLIFQAAQTRDFPMLEAGVLAIGLVYILANLLADALHRWFDPRLREAVAR